VKMHYVAIMKNLSRIPASGYGSGRLVMLTDRRTDRQTDEHTDKNKCHALSNLLGTDKHAADMTLVISDVVETS